MATELTMYQVDAFADRLFAGNPAAVLILQDWLPDALMQAIAMENNLAETAFARAGGDGYDLRWFTPTCEVDFCGHATLATAHVLRHEMGISGDLAFQTRVGRIVVTGDRGRYVLDLPRFDPEEIDDPAGALTEIFPVPPRAFFRNFENLFAELEDETAVRSFLPDHPRIAMLDAGGLVVTARGRTADFVSRYFAPAAGIPEDPVTGSIHATLVPYWARVLGKSRLSAFQASARGGRIDCELAGERVLLSGSAVTYMRAGIFLPS